MAEGTVIKENATNTFIKPIIILKENQVLISITAKDYSFISENNLSEIFLLFAKNNLKINMMQSSALSFSVSFDYAEAKFISLLNSLKERYKVKYNNNLLLITLRHYTETNLKDLTANKTILLEQKSRNTIQLVVS